MQHAIIVSTYKRYSRTKTSQKCSPLHDYDCSHAYIRVRSVTFRCSDSARAIAPTSVMRLSSSLYHSDIAQEMSESRGVGRWRLRGQWVWPVSVNMVGSLCDPSTVIKHLVVQTPTQHDFSRVCQPHCSLSQSRLSIDTGEVFVWAKWCPKSVNECCACHSTMFMYILEMIPWNGWDRFKIRRSVRQCTFKCVLNDIYSLRQVRSHISKGLLLKRPDQGHRKRHEHQSHWNTGTSHRAAATSH